MPILDKTYKTKPLDCWRKAKELRQQFYREVATAHDEGKILVSGGSEGMMALPAGLGEYVYLGGEPYGASASTNPDFQQACSEAVEARGFARDLCGYMRMYWGSMFQNRYFFGGEFPKPDFYINLSSCDSHAKWYQQAAEYYGLPYFSIDYPFSRGERYEARNLEYMVNQMNEAIEWMEKTTGREYNDELLIQAVRNECLSMCLWGEICVLNKHIPAPLDHKTMFPLWAIAVIMRQDHRAADFYRVAIDEVRERIRTDIAALASERCRFVDDNLPPWFALDLYRYLEQYGAVVLGSHHTFFLAGALSENEDGTLIRGKTLDEEGFPMRNRQEVLKAYAWWYMKRPLYHDVVSFPLGRAKTIIRIVREWSCNGVIIHQNRGCELNSCFGAQDHLALQKENIPCIVYEGNMVDQREFDRSQIFERLESFMESMGFSKLKSS